MKRLHAMSLCMLLGFASNSQISNLEYTISGSIQGISSGKMYFTGAYPLRKKDSAEIKNGTFDFKGSLPEPSRVILYLENNTNDGHSFTLFLDKGLHTVKLNKEDLSKGHVKGSSTSHDYELFKSIERPLFEELRSIIYPRDTAKSAQDAYFKAKEPIDTKLRNARIAFIKSHPNSAVAAWAAYYNFLSTTFLEEVYNLISPSVHYTSYAVRMKDKVEKNELLAIGKMAPNFTQNNTLGLPVSLTDFRGKYVLIDFWASWCGPCRKDNPNIVKAFNRFNDKGFTILGVSVEQLKDRQAWLNAIRDDSLTWTHVTDFKYWDNSVVKQYGITGVPFNILVGPDGKILAKDMHGDELQKALEMIIK